MPTLGILLNPTDFDLRRLLEELANEPGGFRTEQLERARANLIDFSQFIDPSFEVNWHHALIAEQLELVATGAVSKLMVLCPPRHGKTVLCSHHFPAWLLARQDEAVVGRDFQTLEVDRVRYSFDLCWIRVRAIRFEPA